MLSDEEQRHPHRLILCGSAFVYPYREEDLEYSLHINYTITSLTRNIPVTMRVPNRNQNYPSNPSPLVYPNGLMKAAHMKEASTTVDLAPSFPRNNGVIKHPTKTPTKVAVSSNPSFSTSTYAFHFMMLPSYSAIGNIPRSMFTNE